MLQASGRSTTKRDFAGTLGQSLGPLAIYSTWSGDHGLIIIFVVEYKLRDTISVPAVMNCELTVSAK